MNSVSTSFHRSSQLVPSPHELQRGEVCSYPIRVIIANPQVMVIWSLRALIQQFARHMHVVGEVDNLNALKAFLSPDVPSVVLLDGSLITRESMPTIQSLLNGYLTQFLLMVDNSEEGLKREGLAHGIRGFIGKGDPPAKLFRAIEALHNGETWFNPIWVAHSAQQLTTHTPSRKYSSRSDQIASLTKSELETIQTMYLYVGEKNYAVAEALKISPSTLRNRLTVIYEKLDVTGKAALILFVKENGLAPS